MVINRKIRSFIALSLSEEVLEGLKTGQDAIRETGVFAGFPRISSIHLTLKFLGEISPDQVALIQEKLEERISLFEPFVLEIRGLGAFPSISRPRIVWAGLKIENHLVSLHRDVENAMQEIGFEPDTRKFSPHITLARIKSPGNENSLEAVLGKMKNFKMGCSPVHSVRLYESILNPAGAVHKVLAEINSGKLKKEYGER